MSETLLISLVGYLVTLLVAVGGWVLSYRISSQARRMAKLDSKVNRLTTEVRARIALEKASCDWLSECTGRTADAIKRDLRSRAQAISGLRPKLSDSDIAA